MRNFHDKELLSLQTVIKELECQLSKLKLILIKKSKQERVRYQHKYYLQRKARAIKEKKVVHEARKTLTKYNFKCVIETNMTVEI